MPNLNRIKVVLVEKGKTGKWLAEQLGKSNCSVSKWCSYSEPIPRDYYNSSIEIAKQHSELCNRIKKSTSVLTEACRLKWNTDNNDIFKLLDITFIKDLLVCLAKLGHQFSMQKKESLPIFFCTNYLLDSSMMEQISYEKLDAIIHRLGSEVENALNLNLDNQFFEGDDEYDFSIVSLLKKCGDDQLVISYTNVLYRLSSLIAKADDEVTEQEKVWLKRIMEKPKSKQKEKRSQKIDTPAIATIQNNKPIIEEDPIAKLNMLIGLGSVKNEITSLSNLVYIQGLRAKRGMKTTSISYHCVFTGNPGTGKTTVARIVAQIYKNLGILKKGHLVETDRSGLVADYVGQTATKTNAIIDSALDGVLFIDEAYSLVQGGNNDYGKEAISTLLKRMEDDRSKLIVILAGYTKEMEEFINSNSGLQSRFSRYIEFPDYTEEELLQIFYHNLKENDCMLAPNAEDKIKEYIHISVVNKTKNFGNARFIRNLFEQILTQQANRVALLNHVSVDILSRIELEDVIAAIN